MIPRLHWQHLCAVTAMVVLAGLAVNGQEPQRITSFRPVTDAMLQKPDPGEWLAFRRTLDEWGYSPLDQINRRNVQQLQLVWSWTLHEGGSEPSPIVHDGVMFLPNAGGGVQALDATTGELLWDFPVPTVKGLKDAGDAEGGGRSGGRPTDENRNLAIYGDKIYVATGRAAGARLIALNAKTGQVVWNSPAGFRHTAGPIAFKGKIVVSTNGCENYKKDDPPCFIMGFDAETGKELWRTSTIARPGEPGGDTWGDLPLMFRAGGDNWQAGSIDPALNLTFWGTAQAKPWTRYQRGTDGAALYTNSTLALDLDTGKMKWYYQHLPGEQHDMDETFERILLDHDGVSSVFSMGKIGILWELDRKTGAFRAAHDLGYQNLVNLDPRTGAVTYRPGMTPVQGVPITQCPAVSGFRTWRAMSYDPQTQAFYIPLNLHCLTQTFGAPPPRVEGGGGVAAGGDRKNLFHPESPDGLGEFVAMDMRTGKINWRYRTRTMMDTAVLTTAGGLAVVGDWDRNMYVFDVETGKVLWQIRLPTTTNGFPITYMIRGRQYLAVQCGTGSAGNWNNSVPRALLPDKHNEPYLERPTQIFVFALPETQGRGAR